MQTLRREHAPFMIFVMVALVFGVWAGLLRVGWNLPPLHDQFALAHGVLMVGGFLGTLISLERAVALSLFLQNSPAQRLPYLAPLFSAVGALCLVFDLTLAALFVTLGSVGMVAIFGFIIRKQPANFTFVMGAGALCWLIGNLIWLSGEPLFMSASWWMAFVILTIVGERLELSRLMRHAPHTKHLLSGLVVLLLVSTALTYVEAYDWGMRLFGVASIGLGAWLLRYDIVRRTIRQTGLARYIAVCLALGYVWLVISGGLALNYGGVKAGMAYDAILHSVFLGFTFSMIFGHAPIILPSILNIQLRYHPTFYAHLAMLHLSLALRVGGDLSAWQQGRQWGAMLNAVVLLLFFLNSAWALHLNEEQPLLPRGRWSYAAYFGAMPLLVLGAIFTIAGAVMSLDTNSADPNVTNASADVAVGQRLYQSNCASCHGIDLRGINGVGKNLIASDYVRNTSDEDLLNFIIVGRPIYDPMNTTGLPMPARGGNPALSDEDIQHIIAYIRQKMEE